MKLKRMHLANLVLRLIRHFRSDRAGNVSVIFAFSLLPMIGIVGLGIDFSRTSMVKATLDASADAAALAAVTEAEATLQSPYGLGPTGLSTAIYAGQTAGQKVFAVDAARVGSLMPNGVPTPTVSISQNASNALIAQVTYAGSVTTGFGGMFGVQTMGVGGSSASSLTLPKWMNISVVIDNSQSMGLAATSAGMTKLQSLTPDGCAFGCHVQASAQVASRFTTPYEQVAKLNGIQLRIDVIRSSTQSMIQTAQGEAGVPTISFSLFTMNGTLAPLAQNSQDYSTLLLTTSLIDLDATTDARGIGDTQTTVAMNTLTPLVPVSGNGSNSAARQQFVFIMSDGVEDDYCLTGYGSHCTKAFDPALCSALKLKGVTVGVIYTTYLQMNSNTAYQKLVLPFDTQMAPNLKSCASPGWYYEASDATDIQAAVNALFSQATGHGILTQ